MDTIFINSGNSKTFDHNRLLLNVLDKINLKRSDKYVPLSKLCIYHTWKNLYKPYKNNKIKISTPTWKEEFELLVESYSLSNIQDCF